MKRPFHIGADKMSNEELAIEIQNGNKEAVIQLWEQVEKFIISQAHTYYRKLEATGREYIPEPTDLIAEGYFAMLEAVKYYSTRKGYKYITYLSKTLKKAFYAVSGYKTLKEQNEPLNKCKSLNIPLNEDSDNIEVIDIVTDKSAYEAFSAIEITDRNHIISNVLSSLNEADKQLLQLKYWQNLSYAEIGRIMGISNKAVIARERKLLIKLRINEQLNAL